MFAALTTFAHFATSERTNAPKSSGVLLYVGSPPSAKGKAERVYDAIDSGVLAMDAYVFK